MGLREKFAAVTVPPKASIDVWFDGLSKDDQAAVLEYAVLPNLSTAKFLEVIRGAECLAGKESAQAFRRRHGYTPHG